jgi:hypothetical protein
VLIVAFGPELRDRTKIGRNIGSLEPVAITFHTGERYQSSKVRSTVTSLWATHDYAIGAYNFGASQGVRGDARHCPELICDDREGLNVENGFRRLVTA